MSEHRVPEPNGNKVNEKRVYIEISESEESDNEDDRFYAKAQDSISTLHKLNTQLQIEVEKQSEIWNVRGYINVLLIKGSNNFGKTQGRLNRLKQTKDTLENLLAETRRLEALAELIRSSTIEYLTPLEELWEQLGKAIAEGTQFQATRKRHKWKTEGKQAIFPPVTGGTGRGTHRGIEGGPGTSGRSGAGRGFMGGGRI